MHIQIPVTVFSLSPCCDVTTVVNVKMYAHGRLQQWWVNNRDWINDCSSNFV